MMFSMYVHLWSTQTENICLTLPYTSIPAALKVDYLVGFIYLSLAQGHRHRAANHKQTRVVIIC